MDEVTKDQCVQTVSTPRTKNNSPHPSGATRAAEVNGWWGKCKLLWAWRLRWSAQCKPRVWEFLFFFLSHPGCQARSHLYMLLSVLKQSGIAPLSYISPLFVTEDQVVRSLNQSYKFWHLLSDATYSQANHPNCVCSLSVQYGLILWPYCAVVFPALQGGVFL